MWRKALALGLVLMAFGVVVGGIFENSNLTYRLTKKYTNPEKAAIVGGAAGTALGWLGGKAIDYLSGRAAAYIGARVGARVGAAFGGLVGVAVGLVVGAAVGY